MKNENNTKAMFIKTKDLETSKNLEREGFDLVDYSNGIWTFINNSDRLLTFAENKAVYSNTLCF